MGCVGCEDEAVRLEWPEYVETELGGRNAGWTRARKMGFGRGHTLDHDAGYVWEAGGTAAAVIPERA